MTVAISRWRLIRANELITVIGAATIVHWDIKGGGQFVTTQTSTRPPSKAEAKFLAYPRRLHRKPRKHGRPR